MEFKMLTDESREWHAAAEYVQNCSWRAGKTLAEKMRHNHFTDWERVMIVMEHRLCDELSEEIRV